MSRIPWWAKIAAKLVLARLPLGPDAWRLIGVFRPGAMDVPAYARDVFARHLAATGPMAPGFAVLELGPGDSLFTAVIAKAMGAGRVYLVDSGRWAAADPEPYRRLARQLRAEGLPAPVLDDAADLDAVLDRCDASYLYDGLRGLQSLPAEGIDMIFSQAVLEHVFRDEFAATAAAMRRALRPGGGASHVVDLRDHLAGALNNLRFSERVWESPLFRNSGFYTNRLRMSEMLAAFEQAGFAVELGEVKRWPGLPTPRRALAPAFATLPDEELTVSGFHVVLR